MTTNLFERYIMEHFWIRTKEPPHFFIYEIRGCLFVTWLTEDHRGYAVTFTNEIWIKVLADMTGFELEAVKPY